MTEALMLDDANSWSVSRVKGAEYFFRAVQPLIEDATHVFLEGSPAREVLALLRPHIDQSAYLAPIGTLWVNAIRMTVIPLVVSLLITGVASASDISMVGRIGGRTLAVFLAMLAGATALALPLAMVVFSGLSRLMTVRPALPPGAAEAASSVAAGASAVGFATWLTSLIPTNPVAAAASGAMLPLSLIHI